MQVKYQVQLNTTVLLNQLENCLYITKLQTYATDADVITAVTSSHIVQWQLCIFKVLGVKDHNIKWTVLI